MDQALLQDSAYHRRLPPAGRITCGVGEFYIIVSGMLKRLARDSNAVAHAGDAVGLREFFSSWDKPETSFYEAIEDTTLFVFTKDTFDDIAHKHPRVLYGLLHDICSPSALYGQTNTLRSLLQQRVTSIPDQEEIARVRAAFQEKFKAPAAKAPAAKAPVTKASAAKVPATKASVTKASAAKAPATRASATKASTAKASAAKASVAKASAEKEPAAKVAPSMPVSLFPQGHKSHPGVYNPDYLKFLYPKELTCPNCGKSFSAYKIFMSKLMPSKPTRFDLREYYRDFDLAWYDILPCPHCYFSTFISAFTEPKNFNRIRIKEELPLVRASLTLDFSAERDLDFVFAAHYLALVCADAFLHHNQMKSRLWANLSWLYEDAGDMDMMRYAARQCAQANEALYSQSNMNPTQEQALCLTTAGMLYRAGERSDTQKWLFKAKTAKTGKKMYVDLADDLLDMIRAEQQPT